MPICLPFYEKGNSEGIKKTKDQHTSICLQKSQRWALPDREGIKAGTFHIQADAGRPGREPQVSLLGLEARPVPAQWEKHLALPEHSPKGRSAGTSRRAVGSQRTKFTPLLRSLVLAGRNPKLLALIHGKGVQKVGTLEYSARMPM